MPSGSSNSGIGSRFEGGPVPVLFPLGREGIPCSVCGAAIAVAVSADIRARNDRRFTSPTVPCLHLRGVDRRCRPERVELTARLETPGWLVLTDTDYPGWQATVDGRPVEIIPANLMFRAVALPAGEHTVLFEFKPRSLQLGAVITGLALLVLAAGLAFTGLKR